MIVLGADCTTGDFGKNGIDGSPGLFCTFLLGTTVTGKGCEAVVRFWGRVSFVLSEK